MTQDQYGQARVPGYVVRDEENEEYASGQSKPMTRFQKVASALRGGGPEQDEEGDYWDEPAASAARQGRRRSPSPTRTFRCRRRVRTCP